MSLEDLGDLWNYLIDNPDINFSGGGGFFFKRDTPNEKIEQLTAYHTRRIKRGEPYFIFDILVHDLERGVKITKKGFWYYLADPDSYTFE